MFGAPRWCDNPFAAAGTAMQPFLLLRARPSEAIRAEFERWFLEVHLEDVRRIPGISEVQSAHTPGGTRLAFLQFVSAEIVQDALASPEAAYARGTWERWAPSMEELHIEIFAPLLPLPLYRSVN